MSIRDAIRKAKDRPCKKVATAKWLGVDVYLRPLTPADYARIDVLSKGDNARRPSATERTRPAAQARRRRSDER